MKFFDFLHAIAAAPEELVLRRILKSQSNKIVTTR